VKSSQPLPPQFSMHGDTRNDDQDMFNTAPHKDIDDDQDMFNTATHKDIDDDQDMFNTATYKDIPASLEFQFVLSVVNIYRLCKWNKIVGSLPNFQNPISQLKSKCL